MKKLNSLQYLIKTMVAQSQTQN